MTVGVCGEPDGRPAHLARVGPGDQRRLQSHRDAWMLASTMALPQDAVRWPLIRGLMNKQRPTCFTCRLGWETLNRRPATDDLTRGDADDR